MCLVNLAPSGFGKSTVMTAIQNAMKPVLAHNGIPELVANCGTLAGLVRVAHGTGGVATFLSDELFGPLGSTLTAPHGNPDRHRLLTILGTSQPNWEALVDKTAASSRYTPKLVVSGLAFSQVCAFLLVTLLPCVIQDFAVVCAATHIPDVSVQAN